MKQIQFTSLLVFSILLFVTTFFNCNQNKKDDMLTFFGIAYSFLPRGNSFVSDNPTLGTGTGTTTGMGTTTGTATGTGADTQCKVLNYETPSCYPDTIANGNLVISEIGDCSVDYKTCWFEVFNSSLSSVNLADFKLRTTAYNASTLNLTATFTFDLPIKTIESGKFHVLRMKNSTIDFEGQEISYISYTSFIPTWWLGRGFIEILDKNNATVDFVRFGTNTESPTSSSLIYSINAPSLSTTVATNPSMTIARDCRLTNTKSGTDWFSRAFPTPAAANDVSCSIDADEDGIPDCAEENINQSYAGWNYYKMGARTNQKDIFVEADWVTGADPLKELNTFSQAKTFFQKRNMNLVIDGGKSPFQCSDGVDFGNEDNRVGNVDYLYLDSSNSTDITVRKLKAQYFRLSRLPVFHYVVVGTLGESTGGIAELFGNDFMIINNTGVRLFLHELGHNLGLHHGGFEARTYKLNYVSIMNYLYVYYYPKIGGANEGFPYYKYLKENVPNLTNTDCFSRINFSDSESEFSYSDGTSIDLNENSLLESKGVGRGSSTPIDYNCNGLVDTNVLSFNTNQYQPSNPNDATKEVLKDYNDWANMKLTFRNYSSGFRTTSPTDQRQIPVHSYMNNDKQEIADETGMPIQ